MGTQTKIDCYSVNGICGHCDTIFEVFGLLLSFCEFPGLQPVVIDGNIVKGQQRRETDDIRWSLLREGN